MPRFRWLAMALVMALLISLLPVPMTVAVGADPTIEAAELLKSLKIVTGDDRGLRLQDKIKRGEMATILVRAAGKADLEPLSRDIFSFPDVVGHWSRGFVAVARNMGLASGRTDGKFYPEDYVTHAEVVAFLVKWAGIQVTDTDWPYNYLRAGKQAGIIPPDVDLTPVANVHALRGTAFRLLHEGMRNIKDAEGRNLYQRIHDGVPPEMSLGDLPQMTEEETFTLEGTVRDNIQMGSLEIGGMAVPVGAEGHFRANLTLSPGANTFTLVATDAVGNVTRKEVTLARGLPDPAEIVVETALEVQVGTSQVLEIQVLDANGTPIPNAPLTGEVVGGIGTFDAATRTFTASRGGTGYLQLQAGSVSRTVTIRVKAPLMRIEVTPAEVTVAKLAETQFTARGYDSEERPVAVDPQWSVEPSDQPVLIDDGLFVALRPGVYTVKATAGGVEGTATVRVYGEPHALELKGPDELVASDGAVAEFEAMVVDEKGTTVEDYAGSINLTAGTNTWGLEIQPVGTVTKGVQKFQVRAVEGVALAGLIMQLDASTLLPDGRALTARKTVELVPQEAAAIKLVAPRYLAVNTGQESIQVQAYVVDQSGQPMNYGLWDINFAVSGPATLANATGNEQRVTYVGDSNPVPATLTLYSRRGQPGEIQVTASLGGVPPATATIQAVIAQQPSKLVLEADRTEAQGAADLADPTSTTHYIEFTLTSTDPNGVPVIGPSEATVQVTAGTTADLAELDIAAVDPLTNQVDTWTPLDALGGTYTANLASGKARFRLRARALTGQVTLRATALGLAEAQSRVTFTAGPPYQVGFTQQASTIYAQIGTQTLTLKAQVLDYYGNPTRTPGESITFTTSNPDALLNGRRQTVTVPTDANGEATVQVTLPPAVGTFTVTASSERLVGGTANKSIAIDVRYAVPDKIEVYLLDGSGQQRSAIEAGQPLTVRAVVYDSYGARIQNLPASALQLQVVQGELAGDVVSSTSFTTSGNGEYNAVIYPGKGPLRVEALVHVAGGVRKGSRSLNVNPGPAARVQLVRTAGSGIVIDAYRPSGPFTVQVTDAYGNLVYTASDVTVSFSATSLAGTGYFEVRESPTGASVTSSLVIRRSKAIYILAGGDPDNQFTLHITPVGSSIQGDTVPVTIR